MCWPDNCSPAISSDASSRTSGRDHRAGDDVGEGAVIGAVLDDRVLACVPMGARPVAVGGISAVERRKPTEAVGEDGCESVWIEVADDVDLLGALVDRGVGDLLLGEPHGELRGGEFLGQGQVLPAGCGFCLG